MAVVFFASQRIERLLVRRKSSLMAVNAPRRAPNPILRITIFELSGIVLFVVLAKLLLAGMLSFFHNINAEHVIGIDGARELPLITPREFIAAIGLMVVYCFSFTAIFQRISRKYKRRVFRRHIKMMRQGAGRQHELTTSQI